jgi:hypothetical protein
MSAWIKQRNESCRVVYAVSFQFHGRNKSSLYLILVAARVKQSKGSRRVVYAIVAISKFNLRLLSLCLTNVIKYSKFVFGGVMVPSPGPKGQTNR